MNFLRRYLVGEEIIPEPERETRLPPVEIEEKEMKVEERPISIEAPRRRILTRAEVLGDIEGSIDPFGLKRLGKPHYIPKKRDEIFDEIIVDDNTIISDTECNDPITLEHQDENSKKFIEEDNKGDHFLLIGKLEDKYFIDCAYRSNLENVLKSPNYRCIIDEKVYYTVTTSFDPYLKLSKNDIEKMIKSTHKIYYILPTSDRCGNGRIFSVKVCGGEKCLEKVFK